MNKNYFYNRKRSNDVFKNYHLEDLRQDNQPLGADYFNYKIGIKASPP